MAGDLAWGVVAVLLVGWGVLGYEWWGLPRRRARVIVNFSQPATPAIEGVLWQRRGRWLVLKDCWLLETARADPTRIDGEVVLDRQSVLFLQVAERPVRRKGGVRHG